MDVRPRVIEHYESPGPTARIPFQDWFDGLNDMQAVGLILNRLERVEMGNLGNHRPVGSGVFELIIDYGPGYRVYYGEDEDKIVLLHGGNKKSQSQDIEKSKEYWRDYNA